MEEYTYDMIENSTRILNRWCGRWLQLLSGSAEYILRALRWVAVNAIWICWKDSDDFEVAIPSVYILFRCTIWISRTRILGRSCLVYSITPS